MKPRSADLVEESVPKSHVAALMARYCGPGLRLKDKSSCVGAPNAGTEVDCFERARGADGSRRKVTLFDISLEEDLTSLSDETNGAGDDVSNDTGARLDVA